MTPSATVGLMSRSTRRKAATRLTFAVRVRQSPLRLRTAGKTELDALDPGMQRIAIDFTGRQRDDGHLPAERRPFVREIGGDALRPAAVHRVDEDSDSHADLVAASAAVHTSRRCDRKRMYQGMAMARPSASGMRCS